MIISEQWGLKRFDEIGEIFSGSTPSTTNKSFWDGDIIWVTPSDLSRLNTAYLQTSDKKITDKGLQSCSAHLLPASSIVISSRAPIGYVAIPTVEFCTNQGCKSIKLKSTYDSAFTYYNINYHIEKLKNVGEGTTFAEISKAALSKIEIPFPTDKQEQTQIAAILSTIDKAIEQTEAIIAKQQRIKSGLMQDLLTRGMDKQGSIRSKTTHMFKDSPIGYIPNEWEAVRLGKLVDIKHGYAFKGEFFSEERNGFVLLTPGNFHVKGGLYFTVSNTKYYTGAIPEEFILKNGDVLVVMTDLTKEMAILGQTVVLEHSDYVLHNQRIGKVIIKPGIGLNSEFLAILMNSTAHRDAVKVTATGTTVRHTSPDKLLSPYVPLVPTDEQSGIVETISSIEKAIQFTKSELDKLHQQKTGLMQDLLTGKVRVSELHKSSPVLAKEIAHALP